MPWLAVKLELDAQTADPMSEALLEAGAQSVSLDNLDAEHVVLRALVGLDADPTDLVAAAARNLRLQAPPAFSVHRVEDEDWVRRSQAQFAPFAIGARLWIGPSWCEPPGAQAIVRLDPGLAFGTGSHPSTRLALNFLARQIRGGERVLDYGCGSGVLSLAAAKLGATAVLATDIDPAALDTAAANARANEVALAVCAPEAIPPGWFDIVVANILAQPLIVLAPLLASRLAAGGCIALSGILDSQAAEVGDAYRPWLSLEVSSTEDNWVLLEGRRG
jgi:ribosomal protein L11 methyltransferase